MKTLSLALALATPIQAALRFGCSTLTVQRLDPVVEPGTVGTSHLHHIIGGNAFNATMEGDIGEKGTCTTCTFSEDFSNYWTAVLFLKAANGSYKRVPIYQNTALPNGINGGMTVYYTQRDFQGNGNVKITSFKPGFRMIVGSPTATSTSAPGLKWVCLSDKGTRFPELNDIPQKACAAGIMSVHHFPACWDGKNLDSPDHQSHMFSTVKEAFNNGGPCPASHPVRVAQVAYETLYDTRAFNSEIAKGGKFVLSTGDSKGFATHADYLFGWKGDSLQRAMDHSCMFNACENGKPLKSQGVSAMNNCKIPNTVHEDIDSWSKTMPGEKMAM
ncbi:hypothetical protein QBC39DRAFT_431308 [Podospora conica]|nr:hypothetical protein QBC39DRAFT_431308 [Schizothecium conicum]